MKKRIQKIAVKSLRSACKFKGIRKHFFGIRKRIILPLRLTENLDLESNVMGLRMNLHLNDWIQQQLYFLGLYETEAPATRLWQNLMKEGLTVIDAGANIGYYTLLAAKRVGSTGKVYAFEPVEKTRNRLSENIALNGFQNVEVIPMAMSDKSGELAIYPGSDENWGMSGNYEHDAFEGEIVKVKSVTLDDFVHSRGIDKIDILKIDVEGSELNILHGGKKTLQELHPILMLELKSEHLEASGFSVSTVYQYLYDLGYSPFAINPDGSLQELHHQIEGNTIIFK